MRDKSTNHSFLYDLGSFVRFESFFVRFESFFVRFESLVFVFVVIFDKEKLSLTIKISNHIAL